MKKKLLKISAKSDEKQQNISTKLPNWKTETKC